MMQALLAQVGQFDRRDLKAKAQRPERPAIAPREEAVRAGKTSCESGKEAGGTAGYAELLGVERAGAAAERREGRAVVAAQAAAVAGLVRVARRAVVLCGAGLSTAAGIPDYRGPAGIWRGGRDRRELGAEPTAGHRCLARLVAAGRLAAVLTTNIDGLEARAGIPAGALVALHGSAYTERCAACHRSYDRDFDVRQRQGVDVGSSGDHRTGRTCECGGELLDTIVHFGEFISDSARERAGRIAWEADLAIVLGTSLRVAPANTFPQYSYRKNSGNMVICNLQSTPLDSDASIRIWSTTDEFLELLELELFGNQS